MIPTPTEQALINEYRQERKRLLERLKHIDDWMARFSEPPGPAVLRADGSQVEDIMPRTIRHAIRQYLQTQDAPRAAPEIAQAMQAEGFYPTYKQTKSNVDSTLGRMVGVQEIEKGDDGYWIKKASRVAA